MNELETRPTVTETVGVLPDQAHFRRAVAALLEAGFERSDLSVLATHESLEAAIPEHEEGLTARAKDALKAMLAELRYTGPLGAAGLTILFGGPVAGIVGAVLGAGIAGMALHEVLSEVLAHPHHEAFARAVAAGGIILWVRAEGRARERLARTILERAGAESVHRVRRPAAEPATSPPR